MQLLHSKLDAISWATEQKRIGNRIGLVPTMGFLHAGHLSLIEQIRPFCDVIIVSIYVNPAQLAAGEDLNAYPQDTAGDIEKLKNAGVNAIFMPKKEDIYPPLFNTYIEPTKLAQHLCGKSRPEHFRGVCTVVSILWNISKCDVSIFGKKDFQQFKILKQMAIDLALQIKVIGAPIIRHEDGLAMSSRNAYLSKEQRHIAPILNQSLTQASASFKAGQRDASNLMQQVKEVIAKTPFVIDYVQCVDAETLQPWPINKPIDVPACLAIAANLGSTRLIDNTEFFP